MIVLKLPELLDLNSYINIERANKYAAHSKKKEQTELVAMECLAQKIPKLERITEVKFIWRHKNRRKDMDNVEFSQKFIWDGMQEAGVIKNDGWKQVTQTRTHEHLVDKENPGVEVRFEGKKR